jgi:hypothetical protein
MISFIIAFLYFIAVLVPDSMATESWGTLRVSPSTVVLGYNVTLTFTTKNPRVKGAEFYIDGMFALVWGDEI